MMLGTWALAVIAFLTFVYQTRQTEKLTRLQLCLEFQKQYDSEYMQDRRGALARSLLDNPETCEIDDGILVFFENLSHFEHRGLLDRDMVWNTFSADVISYWAALKHYVEWVREEMRDPTFFEETERLCKEIAKENKKRGCPETLIGQREEVRRFLKWEARRRKTPDRLPKCRFKLWSALLRFFRG